MEPQKNLVLVFNPGSLDIEDFKAIALNVRRKAPDIAVIITTNGPAKTGERNAPQALDILVKAETAARQAASRPTLVFSPEKLQGFIPLRGRIYCGRVIPKLLQLERLKAAGVPVPSWTVLTPGVKLDAEEWGPIVVVKPLAWGTSQGKGIQMRRTSDVRYTAPRDFPADHLGRTGPMIAQKFIDTGEYSEEVRVLTLFGEPMYAVTRKAGLPRPSFKAPAKTLEAARVAITIRHRNATGTLCFEEDVLALARRVYGVFPEAPLQACDILRDCNDGRLYVLEANPGGKTWHFSSGRVGVLTGGEKREDQFRAFETAADLLIDRTRAEAV